MMSITDQLVAIRSQAAALHDCLGVAKNHVTHERSIECLQELQKAQAMIVTMGEAIIAAKLNVPRPRL